MNRLVKTSLLIAVLILSIQKTSDVLCQDLSVGIEPPDTSLAVGESFTIDVVIDGVTNLGSFQFDVEYLSGVVNADSAWVGNFLGSTGRNVSAVGPVIDNASDTGKVTFGGFSFGTANGPDSSGVLATIKFTAQDTGVTALDLRELQVTDIDGLVQSVASINDGIVRVTPRVLPVDPTRTSVDANPDSIPADGVSTSTITVTPKDSLENNLGAGQIVSLATTAGTLLGLVSDNGDGTYTQLLQSSTTPGTAVITATVNGIEMNQEPQVVFIPLVGVAVRIEPSDTTVAVGETFTIDVVIDNVQNLGSFQFDIKYMSSIVHADSGWLGNFLGSTGRNVAPVGPVIDNASDTGKVTFGGFSFGAPNGPDASGVLATVQFTVQDTGSTALNLMKVQVTDIDGQVQKLGTIGDGMVNAIITSVNDPYAKPIPVEFSISQNYPNPFNPATTIRFQLAKPEWVSMKIFNLLGQEIRTLVDQNMEAGYFTVNWDGKDNFGKEVPSGIYFYQIQAGSSVQVKRMILQK